MAGSELKRRLPKRGINAVHLDIRKEQLATSQVLLNATESGAVLYMPNNGLAGGREGASNLSNLSRQLGRGLPLWLVRLG